MQCFQFQQELEDALKEANQFTAEIQDLLQWLNEIDNALSMSKTVGGLPETASDQLELFMEIYHELEKNLQSVESCHKRGADYLLSTLKLKTLAYQPKEKVYFLMLASSLLRAEDMALLDLMGRSFIYESSFAIIN